MTDMTKPDLAAELTELRTLLRAVQGEVAEVRHPFASEDRLNAAAVELDAIVAATEGATNGILATAEQIGDVAASLEQRMQADPDAAADINRLNDLVAQLFTECSFQDITGQRVANVVKTLSFVEARVEAIIERLGEDSFADLPVPQLTPEDKDAALLNGPQVGNRGVSQADIDSLFG